MKHLTTTGIVLSRVDFGEADRILTILTPEYGKLRLMARGVRRINSKLAGGIELFSISHITFIRGRGDIATLISSRLQKHYYNIVNDMNRTMLGYDLIKLLNRVTEDEPESAYFELMQSAFESLDNVKVPSNLITAWFSAQLLKTAGHSPDLQTDDQGHKLQLDRTYEFSFEQMTLAASAGGSLTANHIKFLRLLFSNNSPQQLAHIKDSEELASNLDPMIQTMLKTHIRI